MTGRRAAPDTGAAEAHHTAIAARSSIRPDFMVPPLRFRQNIPGFRPRPYAGMPIANKEPMANPPDRAKQSTPPPKNDSSRRPTRATGRKSPLARFGRSLSVTTRRVLLGIGILLLLLFVASFFVDEPLRRSIEKEMNRKLTGYSVKLPGAHFSIFDLSVTLKGLTVRQQAHPEPPVLSIPRMKTSVEWKEILTLNLVADVIFDRPSIRIDLQQLQEEARDETPVKDRGWQAALQATYPLEINLLRVSDGNLTYVDPDSDRPLRVSHLHMRAENIRNIHSRDRVYPSPIHAEGAIFDTGHGVLDGHADFLAEPFPGIHTLFRLERVPLDYFRPVFSRANLTIRGGTLDTSGRIEYAPKVKYAQVDDLAIRSVRLDYIHTAATAKAEEARKDKVARAAKEATKEPGLTLRLRRLRLVDSDVGLVNRAKSPPYRVYLASTNLEVTNLSNKFQDGPAQAKLSGKFQGSGKASARATFRPEKSGPDFDLHTAIEGTDMTRMNDLLRAYGKFDVVKGTFSLFTELHVKNGQINGYIKPLFKDMDVYDRRQDKDKSIFRKLYEGLVGGIAKLLENPPRDEVATVATLSGPVGDPKSNTWQVIVRLIQNAFFRAILPGFDRELGMKKKPG